MDALILAGDNKATLGIKGKPMVQYVVNALINSKYIDKVFVIGQHLEGKINNAFILEAENSFYENILKGIKSLQGDRILISTSDIPLVTSEIIDAYIKKCSENDAEIYLPLIKKELNKIDRREYRIPLKEGNFRMGYLFIISKNIFNNKKTGLILEKIFSKRKKDITYLADFLDLKTKLKFLVKYALKSLDIDFLEKEFSRIFNYKGKIIISANPEIMMDVDSQKHLEEILQYLN